MTEGTRVTSIPRIEQVGKRIDALRSRLLLVGRRRERWVRLTVQSLWR